MRKDFRSCFEHVVVLYHLGLAQSYLNELLCLLELFVIFINECYVNQAFRVVVQVQVLLKYSRGELKILQELFELLRPLST